MTAEPLAGIRKPMTLSARSQPTESLDHLVADEGAFRAWYDEVLPRVYRFVFARCGADIALAEELTQQTFVAAIRWRRQFDGRSDVVTWLCAIARNKLVDHYRKVDRDRRRHLKLVSQWSEPPGHVWRGRSAQQAVHAALEQLPGEQRLVLLMRHLDGLSVREIGSVIGRSESGVESLLVRARRSFRRAYGGLIDE